MFLNYEYIDYGNKANVLIAILIVTTIAFIIIGHYYQEAIQARLSNKFMTVPEFHLDGWSVSHFMFYFVLGMLKPNHHSYALLLGIGWELFEDGLSSDKNTKSVDCGTCKKEAIAHNRLCNGFKDSYWYGKWDDILCNMLGYILGSSLGVWDRQAQVLL